MNGISALIRQTPLLSAPLGPAGFKLVRHADSDTPGLLSQNLFYGMVKITTCPSKGACEGPY